MVLAIEVGGWLRPWPAGGVKDGSKKGLEMKRHEILCGVMVGMGEEKGKSK